MAGGLVRAGWMCRGIATVSRVHVQVGLLAVQIQNSPAAKEGFLQPLSLQSTCLTQPLSYFLNLS